MHSIRESWFDQQGDADTEDLLPGVVLLRLAVVHTLDCT